MTRWPVYGQPAARCHSWPRVMRAFVLLAAALLFAGMATGQTTMRIDTPAAGGWPPLNYRFDEAAVRVQTQHGHGQPGSLLVLRTAGSTLAVGAREDAFPSDGKALLAVINTLYRIRFFDLPSNLPARRSVFLRDDGRVGMQMSNLSDTSTTTVCFTLPGFEKCVAWQTDPPQELDALAQRLLADARQAARPAAAPKK